MKLPARGTGKYHIMAEINMIPLIDVALVLLIIFMLISPILVESQLRVNLPKVTTAAQAEETAFKVEIARDGALAFQGKVMSRAEIQEALRRALPPGHNASVLIQADKDTNFQTVVFVMDVAQQLNVRKLGVSVLPELVR